MMVDLCNNNWGGESRERKRGADTERGGTEQGCK